MILSVLIILKDSQNRANLQTCFAFTAAKFGRFPDSGNTHTPVSSKSKMYDGIENNVVLSHFISKKRDWRFNIFYNCRAEAFCNWRCPGAAQGHDVGQSQSLPAPAKGNIKEHSIILPNTTISLIHLFARFTYVRFLSFYFFKQWIAMLLVHSNGIYVPFSSPDIHN